MPVKILSKIFQKMAGSAEKWICKLKCVTTGTPTPKGAPDIYRIGVKLRNDFK